MKKFLYTLALTALFAIGATAQGFQLRVLPRFPAGANVCAEMNDTIVVKNIFASGTTNIKLTPTFPPGMTYVPGSITVLNGGAVTEFNISDLNMPVFSLPNLPGVNDSVTYIIRAKTDCGILDYLLEKLSHPHRSAHLRSNNRCICRFYSLNAFNYTSLDYRRFCMLRLMSLIRPSTSPCLFYKFFLSSSISCSSLFSRVIA